MVHAGDVAFSSSLERLARLEHLCSGDAECAAEDGLQPARDYWSEQLRPTPGGCSNIASIAPAAAGHAEYLLDTATRLPESNEYCTVWNPCTIFSTLYEPSEGRVWVRASDRAERVFEPIAIGA